LRPSGSRNSARSALTTEGSREVPGGSKIFTIPLTPDVMWKFEAWHENQSVLA
jgi:hypothetical protein